MQRDLGMLPILACALWLRKGLPLDVIDDWLRYDVLEGEDGKS